MKEDKKEAQNEPVKNSAEQAMPNANTEREQEARQDEEQSNDDYVIVGSGLGIDE